MVFLKSEPHDAWTNPLTPSTVNGSRNYYTTPVSTTDESPNETRPICDCGNPVAENACMGLGNPRNKGRLMYVCARRRG